MRVKDSGEVGNDLILSKFYYALEIPSATNVVISIH